MLHKGNPAPFGYIVPSKCQSVSVAQVGQVALSACRAIWPPGRLFSDVAAELIAPRQRGHVGVWRVVEFGAEAAEFVLLLEAKKAAGRDL